MAGILDVLKEIHHVRVELTAVREQLRRGPLQVKARENELNKLRESVAAEKEAARRIRMAADARELTLKQAEARLRDLKTKLNMVETNKEYSAIQEEIQRITAENDKLQDEILASISEADEKKLEVQEHERRLREAEEEFVKFKEVLDYKAEKLKGQAEILAKKLAELEPGLEGMLGDYQRLTKTKGDAAIAACEQGICQGCFSEQPPQSKNELALHRPTLCRSCGALLYPV
jgi:predicted  nucleic acid-binding Zn-ribbon protein